MYTAHGHHIPDSPDDGTSLPDHKDDCGGVEGCVACAREAIPFIPLEPVDPIVAGEMELPQSDEETQDDAERDVFAGHVEPITNGLPDPDLEQALDVDPELQALLDEEAEIEARYSSHDHEAQTPQGNAARQRFVDEFLNEDRSNFGETAIRDRFARHEVTDITGAMNAACRGMFVDVALVLDKVLPPGREKFQALVELELAEAWALKAIANLAPVADE